MCVSTAKKKKHSTNRDGAARGSATARPGLAPSWPALPETAQSSVTHLRPGQSREGQSLQSHEAPQPRCLGYRARGQTWRALRPGGGTDAQSAAGDEQWQSMRLCTAAGMETCNEVRACVGGCVGGWVCVRACVCVCLSACLLVCVCAFVLAVLNAHQGCGCTSGP